MVLRCSLQVVSSPSICVDSVLNKTIVVEPLAQTCPGSETSAMHDTGANIALEETHRFNQGLESEIEEAE